MKHNFNYRPNHEQVATGGHPFPPSPFDYKIIQQGGGVKEKTAGPSGRFMLFMVDLRERPRALRYDPRLHR